MLSDELLEQSHGVRVDGQAAQTFDNRREVGMDCVTALRTALADSARVRIGLGRMMCAVKSLDRLNHSRW